MSKQVRKDARTGSARRSTAQGAIGVLATLAACLGLLASVAHAAVIPPTSAPLPGSNFQGGDGDQDNPSNYPAVVDWQHLAGQMGVVTTTNDPDATDSIFDTGSHENRPLNWDLDTRTGGSTPGKANFLAAYSTLDDDRFVYLAFDRQESGGNVFLAFELNQDTRLWRNASNDFIQCRTAGDIILSYKIQNDDNIDIVVQKWVPTEVVTAAEAASTYTNGAGCSKKGTFADFNPGPLVQGAINTGRVIANHLPRTPAAATFGEELFGEAAIDIAGIYEAVFGNPCFDFGQISLHGRSSESPSASLQDLVGPVALPARNCSIGGTKWHDVDADGERDAGEPAIAGYKLYLDADNDDRLDAGEATAVTDADGAYLFANVPDGTHTVREAPDAAQDPANRGMICSFPANATCEHAVTLSADDRNVTGKDFGNHRPATLEVVKQVRSVNPADETVDFAFTASAALKAAAPVPALDGPPGDFGLAHGQAQTFTRLDAAQAPGAYAVTESATPGFRLTAVECTDTRGTADPADDAAIPGAGNPASRTATVDPVSGQAIRCTFVNTAEADVTLRKVVESAQAADRTTAFTFTRSADLGGGTFKLADGGAETVTGLVANAGAGGDASRTYTVSEAVPGGWRLTRIDCDDSDSTDRAGAAGVDPLATLRLSPGESVTCTYTNTRNASVRVLKTEAGGPVTRAWEFRLTGPGGVDRTRLTRPGEANGGELDFGDVREGAYTLCERHIPSGWRTSLERAPHNGVRTADDVAGTVKVCIGLVLTPGQRLSLAVDNTRPAVNLVKSGDRLVHHGDTIAYTFEVSNAGNAPLRDVTLGDPRCQSPAGSGRYVSGDDGDSRLELGEVWRFACTAQAPEAHAAGEENPIKNRAVATARDEAGNEVSDDDEHDTRIIHPAVEVDKKVAVGEARGYVDGPLVARTGQTLFYEFTVTNPGDTSLAIEFDDPRCDAEPTAPASGDTDRDGRLDADEAVDTDGDGRLEEPETWVYRCSHVLRPSDPDPFENIVTVTGRDPLGGDRGTVTDRDSTVTDVLRPDIEVDKTVRRGSVGPFVQGPVLAHVGDVAEYRFEVTNRGDAPLAVSFDDPRCDVKPTGPASGDTDGDKRLDTTETWIYRCSHRITEADPDPLLNTVRVTGTDETGGTDVDEDTAQVDVVHPDIEVDKKVRRGSTGEFVQGPVTAQAGDVVEYEFTVTNPGDVGLRVDFSDPKCDAGTLSGPVKSGGNQDGVLDPGETWTYRCSHRLLETDADPFVNVVTVVGTDPIGGTDTDADEAAARRGAPAIRIVKDGPDTAYHGDTVKFTFLVTNPGTVPLGAVTVTDDRCPSATGPVEKRGGDADDLLEGVEEWLFTCSMRLGAHAEGEENPIRNTATATGRDPQGNAVRDTDAHDTLLLHPAIDIDKSGPATGTAGDRIEYSMTVTNPGDVPIAGDTLVVADDLCDAPPELVARQRGGQADPTPGTLDPGDSWLYRCFVQTGAGDTEVLNVAIVDGEDVNGRDVSDEDDARTELAGSEVLPDVVVSGHSRLAAPARCVTRRFTARVSGARIRTVVWRIDGKVVRRFRSALAEARRAKLRVNPRRYGPGVHRLSARVTYNPAARTRAKTMRTTFELCARRSAQPRFTG